MLVGEAPGREEDRSGEPFVGMAGRVLDAALAAARLRRGEVFVTNVVKCRPPANRRPRPEEVEACADHLERQIALVRPRLLVALGQSALSRLAPGSRLRDWRGRTFTAAAIPILVTYHPAAVLHNRRLARTLSEDLGRARRLAVKAPPPPGMPPRKGRPWDTWVSAGAVVLDSRRRGLLLHLTEEDRWCLPKGTLEAGETPRQAAFREIEEETGLRVRLGPALATTRYEHFRPQDGRNYRKTVRYFTAKAIPGRVRLEPIFDDWRWCTRAEGLALLRYEAEKGIWRRAFDRYVTISPVM
jgi:uracil-DNA glycosylase family 4